MSPEASLVPTVENPAAGIARMNLGEENFRMVEEAIAALVRVERKGLITRSMLDALLEELAIEVCDEWLAKQVAAGIQ